METRTPGFAPARNDGVGAARNTVPSKYSIRNEQFNNAIHSLAGKGLPSYAVGEMIVIAM
jgi:hypothetical protein